MVSIAVVAVCTISCLEVKLCSDRVYTHTKVLAAFKSATRKLEKIVFPSCPHLSLSPPPPYTVINGRFLVNLK